MAAPDESPSAGSGPLSFDEVYGRLRNIAHRERRRFGAARTLNTTALVHEVYLDLAAAGDRGVEPRDFFGYAARSMRNLLTDHARRCLRPKHGGGLHQTDFESAELVAQADASQAVELDAALTKLQGVDARAAEVVELHYFAGLGLGQIAELMGVSERTINRDWRVARAWLESELASG